MRIPKKLAIIRGRAIKKQTTDLDNVKSFSAEETVVEKTFRGLNKTEKVPFPKPKVRPNDTITFPGSAPNNGRLKEAYDGGVPNPDLNNYAQHLPVPANSKKTNMNKKLRRDTIPNASTTYESDVIMALPDLDHIFEAFMSEGDYPYNTDSYKPLHSDAGFHIGSYYDALEDMKKHKPSSSAYKLYKAQAEHHAKEYKRITGVGRTIKEELKIGDKEEDNIDAKKFRGTNAKGPGTGKVARKYLGKQRGTTATGKPAHAIITEPVIGGKDPNWNKTTPSGERKK